MPEHVPDQCALDWLQPLLDHIRIAFREEAAAVALVAGSAEEWPVKLQVGKRLLLIVRDQKGFSVEEIGHVAAGRPRRVPRATVQRQYVECFEQLSWLRRTFLRRLAQEVERQAKRTEQRSGAKRSRARRRFRRLPHLDRRQLGKFLARLAIIVERRRPRRPRKFWLRPLMIKRRHGCDYLAFESQPIESWEPFRVGRFSPSLVAIRILTVFHQLRGFDFLDDEFDDKDLFLRKLIYPLPAVYRARLKKTRQSRRRN